MVQPAQRYISFEEFLIDDANAPGDERLEWVDGRVYAMSFATTEHALLCGNMNGALHIALRGQCAVRDSSTGVYIPTTKSGLRPDLTVVCGPLAKIVVESKGRSSGQAITNPSVIVEVLSDSTERDDRGWRFRDYRTISSLEEYVLVSQTERKIEIFRRAADWQAEVIEETGAFVIHGATLSLDEIYDGLELA